MSAVGIWLSPQLWNCYFLGVSQYMSVTISGNIRRVVNSLLIIILTDNLYLRANLIVIIYRYSQGSGTIWLNNVDCTSSELMLSSCSHNGFGNNNCFHSEDVAVSCSSIGIFGK